MDQPTEQFVPFPAEKRQQLESKVKPGTIHNPHHPNNRQPAQNIQMAGGPRVIQGNPPGVAAYRESANAGPIPGTLAYNRQPIPMAAPIPEPQPYVHVTPNSEDEAVSFELPSNFLFYDFKDLYIKPFKGRQFSKLHRAREEESLLHVVEAVSAVISTATIKEGLGFWLTLPDFYACLYWLRMHSFLKHGFTHQTICRSKKHHEWVEKGRLAENGETRIPVAADTLKHAEIINKASLKTRNLTELPNLEDFQLSYPGLKLVPVLMRDVLEITMNESTDRFAARTASSFQFEDRFATLQERMAIVDDLSGDDIATIAAWEKACSNYGVEESIKWTCKTCGHIHTDELQIEAHSFFPSAA